jgi:hypothetical protein
MPFYQNVSKMVFVGHKAASTDWEQGLDLEMNVALNLCAMHLLYLHMH